MQIPTQIFYMYSVCMCRCVTPAIRLEYRSCVTMNDFGHTWMRRSIYKWAMAHIWISHGTHTNESWHIHECITAHTWMSHGTHTNESWHIHETVMGCRWHKANVVVFYDWSVESNPDQPEVSNIRVTWLIQSSDMTIHLSDMTIHLSDMTILYVWHDSCKCGAWLSLPEVCDTCVIWGL